MDHWLRRRGFASLKKLEERLADKSAKPMKLVSDNPSFSFEAIIDPEDKWGVEDKLSQINPDQPTATAGELRQPGLPNGVPREEHGGSACHGKNLR
ncbi:hypothetical protein ANCCEY_05304 [Ancylostoma ceylanicum]|uniref:Uncharacterized protein n=1 Tax=Ancylostoma ceylanicum TaxID=53326 RepID=A0A0D6LU73_9BILA|nr:hypothetical protein ANCCEY_05304 [Ancylostoma ceylanicum]